MKRNKIMNFISKYNLSGNVDSVRWNFEDNKLKTTFLSPTKALRGSVITDFEYNESAEIGIYETGLGRCLEVVHAVVLWTKCYRVASAQNVVKLADRNLYKM